jgi:hypothetical protein
LDQPDVERRPRSSDAKVDPLAHSADDQSRDMQMLDARHDDSDRLDRRPRSAGSFDREYRSPASPTPAAPDSAKAQENHEITGRGESAAAERTVEEDRPRKAPRKHRLGSLHNRIAAVRKQVKPPVLDQSSESDDEEIGDVIAIKLAETEKDLKKLIALEESTPVDVLVRHAIVSVKAVDRLVSEPEGLEAIIGPIPEGVKITKEEEAPLVPEEEVKVQETVKSPVQESKAIEVVKSPIQETKSLETAKSPVQESKTQEVVKSPVREVKPQEPIVPVALVTPAAPATPAASVAPAAPVPSATPVASATPIDSAAPVTPVVPVASAASATPAAPVTPATPVVLATPVAPVTPVAPAEGKVPSPVTQRVVPLAKEEQPQPSIEEDIDMVHVEEQQETDTKTAKPNDDDVVMKDAAETPKPAHIARLEVPQTNGAKTPKSQWSSAFPEDDPGLSKDVSKRGTSTPSPAEDEDETDVEDIDLQSVDTVRVHANTPPLDCLPEYDEKPWFEDRSFVESLDVPKPALNNFILKRLNEDAMERAAEQQKHRKIYASNYEAYLRFTMGPDPIAVKSREKFNYVPGAPEPPPAKPGYVGDTPKPESTRRSRYASERDLERVLEESRRVEDEKRERQLRAEKEKYRSEKEAVIPDMLQTREEVESHFYVDETGRLDPDKIVAAWEVLPPVDNFAAEEVSHFEKAYLEFPKQWGRVSNNLKDRDFGTTIQFYYLKKDKTELNLKEKLKKRPRRTRKGRGKQRSSALVSEFPEKDETQEVGENGERRRPRRAAAPTFNSEATPATDGENVTGTSTPSRRGGARTADGSEKPERKQRGRKARDKQEKQAKGNQALAPVPQTPTTGKGSRSRSTSRVQNPEWTIPQPPQTEAPQGQPQYELAPSGAVAPPVSIQPPFSTTKPLVSPERTLPPQPGPISEVMAPPPLRPEPPQPGVMTPFEINQPAPPTDRKSGTQASSYWSVPETTDFPHLLSSFGSNWAAIAAHMRTKTAVMVSATISRVTLIRG